MAEVNKSGAKNRNSATSATSPKYTLRELAAQAESLFQTSPDIVTAALKDAGLTEAGKEEAKKIVQAFASAAVPPAR